MQSKSDLPQLLISWFRHYGRDFPWRKSGNPYEVLLAEKLLQQTSVRVALIDLYLFILQRYPSAKELANADVEELRVKIQPLGLHYRATELVRMSKEIVEKFNGELPDDESLLLSLYGIGHYSARAILSFAFGKDVAVVDTNVARIIHRVFDIPGKLPSNPARSVKLTSLAQSILPQGKSKEFNWAMIDLGSLICLPQKPRCNECPINNHCEYFRKTLLSGSTTF